MPNRYVGIGLSYEISMKEAKKWLSKILKALKGAPVEIIKLDFEKNSKEGDA